MPVRRRRNRAFTLIEIVLVVLLLGTLAGAAALSFARPLRAARVREAVAEIGAFDAAARQAARRSGRDVEIVIDAYERRLTRREGDREVAHYSLPAGLTIAQVRVATGAWRGSQSSVRIAAHGWSRSYAMRIVGPEFDRWLLVAGMSGQVTIVANDSNVEDILSPRANARRDAD